MQQDNAQEKAEVLSGVVILIHGVYSEGEWYAPLLKWAQEKSAAGPRHLVVPFSWGDYVTKQQGGSLIKAADEVHQMFRSQLFGYDRLYQGHSVVRLKALIDACQQAGLRVSIMAHSNGSMLTTGALLLGARIHSAVFMGSPLDCDNDASQRELAQAMLHVDGKLYNLWNHRDAWATLKGGIGAFGDNDDYIERNPNIVNVPFVHGNMIRGNKVRSYHPKTRLGAERWNPAEAVKFHHGDYFKEENAPILLSFLTELLEAAVPIQMPQATIDAILRQADWTQTTHYKEGTNVSENETDMERNQEAIQRILRGIKHDGVSAA